MTSTNFIDYRCIDPVGKNFSEPWYRISDSCPCDPNLSNQTGRGYSSCPLGIVLDQSKIMQALKNPEPVTYNGANMFQSQIPGGGLFPNGSSVVPPKLQPRQLVRVGYSWRSGW
jgi:hypothetical protein